MRKKAGCSEGHAGWFKTSVPYLKTSFDKADPHQQRIDHGTFGKSRQLHALLVKYCLALAPLGALRSVVGGKSGAAKV